MTHPLAAVQVWQAGYIQNLLRKEQYALDAQEVREYFRYENVRDGFSRSLRIYSMLR